MNEFAHRLKQARAEKGWNQELLAEAMGISQGAISQFEKGLRLPTPANITKFAEVLDVSRDSLIGEEQMESERVKLMRSIQTLSSESLKKIDEYVKLVKLSEDNSKKT